MFSIIFVAIALVVAPTQSKKCNLKIEEKGSLPFMESIEIKDTKYGKAVITEVPSHRNGELKAVKHIVYDKMSLEIDLLKEFGPKKVSVCLVHHRTMDEPSEKDIESALNLGGCGNKLPRRGSRSDYYYLPRHCNGVLNEEQMKISKEECGDVTMVCGADVEENVETHSKRALELAMDHMQDESKRAVLREFTACDPQSTMALMSCQPSRLVADCHFTTKFCTYGLKCPLNVHGGYWNCNYNHKFAQVKCCDYRCR